MNFRTSLILLLLTCASLATAGNIEHSTSDQGLDSWRLRQGALDLEIVQRLPDQTRGFFLGRGFNAELADRIGTACVMQTILRNVSTDLDIDIDLAQWKKSVGGETYPLKLKSDWEQEWEAAEVSKTARIGFFWSLFPTQQHFKPGDYNWGMISVGTAPGTVFDLNLTWLESGTAQSATISGIVCAEDR